MRGQSLIPVEQMALSGGLALCLLLQLATALPTIKQQQPQSSGGNYVQQLDKSFFQPPEIEQTIDEVQKILANDPALPRLTRGEIEELYEKVTREEYEKSIEAGDMSRADSMRALMLVLPYNTDNNTEENLQELYTRPPVTRVIDAYTPPNPIKFLTPDPNAAPRSTVPGGNPAVAATTWKPNYSSLLRQQLPTTYHPPAPALSPVMYQMTPSLVKPSMEFQPLKTSSAKLPQAYEYAKRPAAISAPAPAPVSSSGSAHPQRFSSHYSAKNAQFLRKPSPGGGFRTSTIKPVADILESLGIVRGGGQPAKRYAIDDYYAAESAPQPQVLASVADLRGLQGARIKPDAYSNFKPLNIGEELRVKPEVEGYLTRFGIVKKSRSKALKKSPAKKDEEEKSEEAEPAGTELATSRLPPQSNAELAKLLENLQELERLQSKTPKRQIKQTTTTTTTTTTPRSTTTTSTTTSAPATATPTVQLITHGAPLLIEPKKPRRRIDPNIDINFGSSNNHQTQPQSHMDELSKLLENLQELEKLKINPENVIKAQTLSNRFSAAAVATSTPRPPSNAGELQQILRQLQQLEAANKASATTTTKAPQRKLNGNISGLATNDLAQLQRLLSDDRELERLYEQARNSKKLAKTTTTSTTTSTSTTTTTPQPVVQLSELEAYFATRTPPPAATAPPPPSTRRPAKGRTPVDHAQFEALITRVQQLEQLQRPTPTMPSLDASSLGFTTRNVQQQPSQLANRLPSNDFAQLQQLAQQPILDSDNPLVEISTAATASKSIRRPLSSNFELANETTNLLTDVAPQDYVQLQKLLSKVQELERVQLQTPTPAPQQLLTAASVRTQNVKSLSGAHIVYAEQAKNEDDLEAELKLDLPVYRQPKPRKPAQSSSEELRDLAMSKPANPMRSEDRERDEEFEQYQQFFSSLEDNKERQSYQNMQPIYKTVTTPSTTTPTPPPTPRFVPAKRTSATTAPGRGKGQQAADLAELQKLLYNAQELKKLGVALPNELSEQLESKFQASSSSSSTTTTTTTTTTPATTVRGREESLDSSSPAVFSLTTSRPTSPRERRPATSTESNIELPIFSATKIIEAAIKRAANRIGVSTEQTVGNLNLGLGFRRRSDDEDQEGAADDMQAGVLDGDLMAEFSQLNYQLALPPPEAESRADVVATPPRQTLGENLDELQRLIINLQELQKLNVSLSQTQQQADAKYLESLKAQQELLTETAKARRQSESSTTTMSTTTTESEQSSTTQAPTKISLSLGLNDEDVASEANSSSSSSTTEPSSSSGAAVTDESRNGSLDDLADSFGPDPITQEPPPAKKKNGFYFLADWNSFLEVGDGDDQVVVRLSPKIGDPRLFLPVKIP